MKTELEIMKMGDEILTEEKKNPNHITTQLNKDEGISYNTGFHSGFVKGYYEALREASKNLVKPDVMQSLPEAKQDAMKAFIEVCNEPIPEGMGKEYLNAMIKMKAFMAGRCFEYEKAKGNVA